VTLLQLEHVDAYYGDFQALFGLDLAVQEGQAVAMIGANGAGKSTLLKTIAGLLPAVGGHVRFDDRVIDGIDAHDRVALGIALVPEGRRIFPSLSVEENLLVGAWRKRAGAWNLGRVLDLFPILRERRARSAAVLSGGEQQALAIGRALMANPRLLLLDEVSLGLAPIVIRQLYAALPEIRASGVTLLLVEQNVDQAVAAADHVYCLLEGRVALEGRPSDLSRDRIRAAYFGI
jgi:branched-chain amino acid transport system ATP-binding protein